MATYKYVIKTMFNLVTKTKQPLQLFILLAWTISTYINKQSHCQSSVIRIPEFWLYHVSFICIVFFNRNYMIMISIWCNTNSLESDDESLGLQLGALTRWIIRRCVTALMRARATCNGLYVFYVSNYYGFSLVGNCCLIRTL
jgi:hypothetical protein